MVELSHSADATALRTSTHNWGVVGLLLVGHVAFAAACTPSGTTSGQWKIPGFQDPDFLTFVASGAVVIPTLVLYSLWAALGPGDFLQRFATTALFCVAFECADLSRAWSRGVREPPLVPIAGTVLLFSLFSVGFWLTRRYWGWQIRVPGDRQIGSEMSASRKLQFSLKLLLGLITFAACITAFCRFQFPHGLPTELTTGSWQAMVRAVRTAPFVILHFLIVLPAVIIPWIALAYGGHGKRAIIMAVMCWGAMDYCLVWLASYLGLNRYFPSVGEWIVALQMGASAAAFISALVFRCSGYRILQPSYR